MEYLLGVHHFLFLAIKAGFEDIGPDGFDDKREGFCCEIFLDSVSF